MTMIHCNTAGGVNSGRTSVWGEKIQRELLLIEVARIGAKLQRTAAYT